MEWLRLLPKEGPRPQEEQMRDMGGSMLVPPDPRKREPSAVVSHPPLPQPLSLALGARARLAGEREHLNAINVYPVADGDTGSNLLATVDAVVSALRVGGEDPARLAADAALLGARGNSGTILSAFVRAALLSLTTPVDGPAVSAALAAGADAAYAAVPQPVEGTMLTVARAAAAASIGASPSAALTSALDGARVALEETPTQLEQLGAAGVVDAGAAGIVAILEGLVAALTGEEVVDAGALELAPIAHVHDPTSRYRWCVGFVLRGADPAAVRTAAADWGDSVVVVGDAELARVHVHVDDAEATLASAALLGDVSEPAISDMHAGIREATARRTGGAAIVYDSTADLPVPDRDNWQMVPLTVHFGDEELRDYVDLDADRFYARLQTSAVHPRTSQPSPGAFAAVYRDLLRQHDHVVSIHISSKLSGTWSSAQAAARDFPDQITVIDSRAVSMPLALAVMRAQQALDEGVPPSELPAVVERMGTRGDCLFSVPTLEYLQRGGRIGRAQALVGSLLGVRPLLAIEDGEVVPAGKVRGAERVLPALVDEFCRRSAPYPEIDVAIGHAADPAAAAELEALVRASRTGIRSVRVLTLGAVIGAHAGPGALGLAYVALD
jgi:DegV family protein with EDD domain